MNRTGNTRAGRWTLAVLLAGSLCGLPLAACEHHHYDADHYDREGRSKTVTKRTYDTPDGKRTETYSHEKKTDVYPK